jgi:excisionase family DNA binding protein
MTAKLLRIPEVAERLNVSRSYAYLLIKRGEIRPLRIGTEMRVAEQTLAAYIRAREQEAEFIAKPKSRRGHLRAVAS